MKTFPCGRYGRQQFQFHPAPFRAPLRSFAALVFPWRGDEVLLCDIEGRGWCVPSGRVEPAETPEAAALRECREEAGATLEGLQYIGAYEIRDRHEVRWADCFTAHVLSLFEFSATPESKARRFIGFDELPNVYYLWNDLTKKVFEHSLLVLRRSEELP